MLIMNPPASHSPQLAAGSASIDECFIPLKDRRFSAAYCGELQSVLDVVAAFEGCINTFLQVLMRRFPCSGEVFLDTWGTVADNPNTSAACRVRAGRLQKGVKIERKGKT
jgi:hypothetical protein